MFIEWLEVSTALLFCQMYPKKGVDIERLSKKEQEIETYFKDSQNTEADYNIFDNYDTNTRIGINRNYDII